MALVTHGASEFQPHEQSKFGAIGCCALDVAVSSNYTSMMFRM